MADWSKKRKKIPYLDDGKNHASAQVTGDMGIKPQKKSSVQHEGQRQATERGDPWVWTCGHILFIIIAQATHLNTYYVPGTYQVLHTTLPCNFHHTCKRWVLLIFTHEETNTDAHRRQGHAQGHTAVHLQSWDANQDSRPRFAALGQPASWYRKVSKILK